MLIAEVFLFLASLALVLAAVWFQLNLLTQSGELTLRLERAESLLLPRNASDDRRTGLGLPAGTLLADFSLPLLTGDGSITLSQWRGKSVVLIFINPRCGHCGNLMSHVSSFLSDAADSELTPIVISTGSLEANKNYIAKYSIACPVLLEADSEVFKRYQIKETPTAIVVGPSGTMLENARVGPKKVLALLQRSAARGLHSVPRLVDRNVRPSALPEIVWSKGIAAQCDYRFPDEFPDGQYVREPTLAGHGLTSDTPANLITKPRRWRDIPEGALVWVRVSWLRSFVRQILPQLRAPFVLVTGNSDSSVPSQIPTDVLSAIENSNVLHWFAQNCDAVHSKISPVPIGIDFHTINDRPNWGEPITPPYEQEQLLKSIQHHLPPVEQRIPYMYVDFAWQKVDYGGRFRTVANLQSNPRVFLQESFLTRETLWRERGEFAYVVSPRGMGLDCHRTWEALALGHIVLVPSSPLDCLYNGLAVVPISDWSAITDDQLAEWLQQYGPLTRSNPRLTSAWWIEQMRVLSRSCRPIADTRAAGHNNTTTARRRWSR